MSELRMLLLRRSAIALQSNLILNHVEPQLIYIEFLQTDFIRLLKN